MATFVLRANRNDRYAEHRTTFQVHDDNLQPKRDENPDNYTYIDNSNNPDEVSGNDDNEGDNDADADADTENEYDNEQRTTTWAITMPTAKTPMLRRVRRLLQKFLQ